MPFVFGADPAKLFNGKPQATAKGGHSRLRLAVKREMNGFALKETTPAMNTWSHGFNEPIASTLDPGRSSG